MTNSATDPYRSSGVRCRWPSANTAPSAAAPRTLPGAGGGTGSTNLTRPTSVAVEPGNGARPCERLPGHHGERVLVRCRCRGAVADLLGAGVQRRPGRPQVDVAGMPSTVGDPEVGQVAVAGLVEEDVGRLHVPVHDPQGVRRRQRATDLLDQARRPRRHRADRRLIPVGQRTAPQQPEHQERPAGPAPVVVERHHMGVLDAGHQLGLGLEALHEPRVVGQLGADRP